jgi:hypothetical protein
MILFVPKLNIRATIVFFFSFHCNSHCDYSNQKKKRREKGGCIIFLTLFSLL